MLVLGTESIRVPIPDRGIIKKNPSQVRSVALRFEIRLGGHE